MVTNNLYLGGSLNGGISYNSTADTLEFMMTNGGTHSELNSGAYVPSTNAGKDIGQHNKRWDSIYCTGVAFGGNTDGADTLLDDYEEGIWTPTISGVSGSTVYRAYYIKVGRKVSVFLNTAVTGGNSNGFSVTLPFAAITSGYTGASQGVEAVGTAMLYNASMPSSTYNLNVYCWSTTATLYASRTGMAWTALQGNQVGSSVILTATYVSG